MDGVITALDSEGDFPSGCGYKRTSSPARRAAAVCHRHRTPLALHITNHHTRDRHQ